MAKANRSFKLLFNSWNKNFINLRKEYNQMTGCPSRGELLAHLCSLADDEYEGEEFWRSDRKLAWELGHKECTVRRSREWLKEKKYINYERKGYKGKNHITVNEEKVLSDLEKQLKDNKTYELEHNPLEWGPDKLQKQKAKFGPMLDPDYECQEPPACANCTNNICKLHKQHLQIAQTLYKTSSKSIRKSLFKEIHPTSTQLENLVVKGTQLTLDEGFEMLADAYEHKSGPGEARKAFLPAINENPLDLLVAKAKAQALVYRYHDKYEPKTYRKALSGWLNDERFQLDYPSELELKQKYEKEMQKGQQFKTTTEKKLEGNAKAKDTIIQTRKALLDKANAVAVPEIAGVSHD